jgi:hypothetical protein
MLQSSRPDRFALSLPPQTVRGGPVCFRQDDLTVSPCLNLLRLYVGISMLPSSRPQCSPFHLVFTSSGCTWGISMLPSCRPDRFSLFLPQDVRGGSVCFRHVDLTVSPCLYLLRMYVAVLYTSVKST